MAEVSALEYLLRRDRVIVAVGLAFVVTLAWGYLVTGAGMGATMADMAMDDMPIRWSPSYAVLMFVMWWVMMVAMMVPSAAPTILLFATIRRRQEAAAHPPVDAWVFLGAYLLTWAGFSLLATLAQWGLQRAGLLSSEMMSTSAVFGGVILLATGLYQFTPFKNTCLRYCQSPVLFLSRYWQPEIWGAFRMGLRHGGYCLGCCWSVMALLFVGGIMNLVWIAGIALYVASEKLLPMRRNLSRASGAILIASGTIVLARTFMAVALLVYPRDGAAQDLLRYVDLNSPDMSSSEMTRVEVDALLKAAAKAATEQRSADLEGKRLSHLDLSGLDFSGSNLRLAKLNRSNLKGARLDRAILNQAWLIEADLTEASLVKASLLSTQMQRVKLGAADLSGARITGDLSGASLTGAKLAGADLSADMHNQSMGLMRGVLKSADLKNADLSGANLARADLSFAKLQNANLSNCNLNHADLAGADLTNANLAGADLTEADLTSTLLPGAAALAEARNLDKAWNLDRARRPQD